MKYALTVWDGRISPMFDVCREALILDIENKKVISTSTESLDNALSSAKVERLVALKVETLVCGAISEPLHQDLTARGVKVIGFVAGEIDDVLQAIIADRLPAPALSMPGCCGQQNRFRRRQGQRRGRGKNWSQKGQQ
jgi:predicted Fe-Mo cluster-binding NifX family protein